MDDSPQAGLWKALFAEFLGTFSLVLIIAGVATLTPAQGGSILAVGIASALILIALIYIFGQYSGAHFNPAVSLGITVVGQMSWLKMLLYWIVQFAGGILAALLVVYLFGSAGATIGSLTNTEPWKAVAAEAIATFFLVLTILFITQNKLLTTVGGIAIGFVLAAGIIAIGFLTGGSLNPARSLGPAIFSNNLSTYWIYLIGPLIGGLVAAIVYWLYSLTTKHNNCCYSNSITCS